MLASGMTLQRLARIQGHGIRVLDEAYSEQLAEFEERDACIDPVQEIEVARKLVWAGPGLALKAGAREAIRAAAAADRPELDSSG